MKRIHEMTMAELSVCLCKMVEPAERIFSDGAVIDALREMRNRLPEKTTVDTAVSIFAAVLFPVLMSDAHKQDAYAILDALGAPVQADTNGLEALRDLFVVFVSDREVESLFRPCAEARGKKDHVDAVQVRDTTDPVSAGGAA